MKKRLNIMLKPAWGNDTIIGVDASLSAEGFSFKATNEKSAMLYPNDAFGGLCPFPLYDRLRLCDDNGEIPYRIEEKENAIARNTECGIYVQRDTVGTVKWSYFLYPRILPDGYVSSPLYDFRNEPNGLNGSGMFSLILPNDEDKIDVTFEWDLSMLPSGARGIWSYGEGTVKREMTIKQVQFSMFQVGVMQSAEFDSFGVYWFTDPDFDVREIAKRLYPIYRYMKTYFHDETSNFRVFLRRDPFEHSIGGSACPYAFISGYSAMGGNDPNRWMNNLIHEMTHTWPYMIDVNTGEGTWFSEGCTEYYCTMLPYHAGLMDASYTLERINDKAKTRYYDNPYRSLPAMEIPNIQWKERQAQKVPYGRGFVYLANVNTQLERAGLGSIDDIVRKHNILNPITQTEWRTFISERLGEKGINDFEDMMAGKLIVPEESLFGDAFRTVEEEVELNGKMEVTYRWELS